MAEEPDLDRVLRCDRPEQIVGVANRLIQALPADIRRRLNHAKLHYLATEDVQGLFARFNGRTVAELLADADRLAAARVVAEGERDGVRFTLYDPPPPG